MTNRGSDDGAPRGCPGDHAHHPHETAGQSRGHSGNAEETGIRSRSEGGHRDHGHSHAHGNRALEMGFAIASGVAYAAGLLAELAFRPPEWLPLTCYLAAYFFGGYFTISSALRSIRRGRFEVDFLMLVAAIGAAAVGKFSEGAVLLFLFSLGHALEEYAMGRAARSVEALAELAPPTALVLDPSGEVTQRPTGDLAPGDVIVIKAHARIPADGYVIAGSSAVDQSSVTGESIPAEKSAVDPALIATPAQITDSGRVFAGTVNGPGALEVVVSVATADNTLARLVALVREADSTKSRAQLAIDRFQRWYVPAVILGVFATFVVGVMLGEATDVSFYRAMLVLVAASPCALAIATPAAVLAGVARAARAGLLVKGGAALENLGRVDAVAFDKTGTLTWGLPQLTDVVPAPGVDVAELQRVALAVESGSDHPLAGAITRSLSGQVPATERYQAEAITAVPGHGVRGVVGGQEAAIGNVRLFAGADESIPPALLELVKRLEGEGRTSMIVRGFGRYLGILGVMDTPRAEAHPVMVALRAGGVTRLVMISGDNQQAADAVGRHVGIDTAHGGLLPEDKVQTIAELAAAGHLTAMVGDGVNDAPAMAHAAVGVAMGAAGSAVALETAEVALMSDDIGRIPFLLRLGRATSKVIRQNLIAALVIVCLLIPAALFGVAMGPVVLIHEGSTLLVVANALRLLRFGHGAEHHGIEHEARPIH